MRRQDKQGFHQGTGQNQNDHNRDIAHNFAHGAAGHRQGPKSHHGCQDRKYHRTSHLQCAFHRCLKGTIALLLLAVDVLADNDGVIHHDAQHHDKGEQRYHVDGNIHFGQHH